MAVFLCDLAILVVDNQFGLLVLAYLSGDVYCILFVFSMLDCAFTAADFDIPTATLRGHYVMRFSHDFSNLMQVMKGNLFLESNYRTGVGTSKSWAVNLYSLLTK